MLIDRISQTTAAMMLATVVAFFGTPTEARGHGPDDSHSENARANSGHDHADQDHGRSVQRPSIESEPAHAGQVAKSQYHVFEVVYRARETRVYVYGPAQRPVSARGIRGQLVMQVRGNPQPFRYPLQYRPAQQDGAHDYLVAAVDVSRIRDGQMQVTVELADLPYRRQEPQARFTQTFALSHVPRNVTVAQITAADQPAIARQGFCPVMETSLGDHGEPIKVLVGDQPLYLCCEGCIEKVQQNPEPYLQKVGLGSAARQEAPTRRTSTPPRITVTQATAVDQRAIQAQGVCPVMNQRLGGHGTPIKITIDDQALFVCCKGCIRKVEQNPILYLAKAGGVRHRQ